MSWRCFPLGWLIFSILAKILAIIIVLWYYPDLVVFLIFFGFTVYLIICLILLVGGDSNKSKRKGAWMAKIYFSMQIGAMIRIGMPVILFIILPLLAIVCLANHMKYDLSIKKSKKSK